VFYLHGKISHSAHTDMNAPVSPLGDFRPPADYAVETFCPPYAAEMPWKAMVMWALGVLFEGL